MAPKKLEQMQAKVVTPTNRIARVNRSGGEA